MFSSLSNIDVGALLPTRSNVEGVNDEDEGWIPSLTFQERLIGCVSCMAFGYLLSLGSFFRIKALVTGDPVPFVVNATVGNVIALCGSFFMSGPVTQAKKMFHESRRLSSLFYLGSLSCTLLVSFLPSFSGQGLILLICMILQWASIFWYCLSYIPFARDAVKRWLNRYTGDE